MRHICDDNCHIRGDDNVGMRDAGQARYVRIVGRAVGIGLTGIMEIGKMANTTNNETKRVPAIAANVSEDFGTLTLSFANDKTLSLHVSQLTPTVGAYALMHGLKQKLVDAAAISCNQETGRPATIDDKYEAVKTVFDRLIAGHWNKPRESGTAVAGGLLFKALCRMYANKTPDELREFLAGKTDEQKAALRKNPRVAAIIEEIKLETAKIDPEAGNELLGELDAMQ